MRNQLANKVDANVVGNTTIDGDLGLNDPTVESATVSTVKVSVNSVGAAGGTQQTQITGKANFTKPAVAPATLTPQLANVTFILLDVSHTPPSKQQQITVTNNGTLSYSATFNPVPKGGSFQVQAIGNWTVQGSITDDQNLSANINS